HLPLRHEDAGRLGAGGLETSCSRGSAAGSSSCLPRWILGAGLVWVAERTMRPNSARLILLVLVFSNLPAASASADQPASPCGTLCGRVADAVDQKPLGYANVVILGTKLGAQTDEQGNFTIDRVPAGAWRVRVLAMGADPVTTAVIVAGTTQTPPPAPPRGGSVPRGTRAARAGGGGPGGGGARGARRVRGGGWVVASPIPPLLSSMWATSRLSVS